MVCGRWVQDGNLKIYNEVYEFYISPIHCEILWGENDKNVIFNYDSWIHSMPKRNEKVRAEMHKRKNTIIESYKQGLVIINPKYSSGNRRIQCSINIEQLFISGIPFKKYTDNYKGLQLPYVQESNARNE